MVTPQLKQGGGRTMNLDIVEKNIGAMLVGIIFVISLGGLAEIVPLFYQDSVTTPVPGLRPLSALESTFARDVSAVTPR